MKRGKISINKLEVRSFVTSISDASSAIKGKGSGYASYPCDTQITNCPCTDTSPAICR